MHHKCLSSPVAQDHSSSHHLPVVLQKWAVRRGHMALPTVPWPETDPGEHLNGKSLKISSSTRGWVHHNAWRHTG